MRLLRMKISGSCSIVRRRSSSSWSAVQPSLMSVENGGSLDSTELTDVWSSSLLLANIFVHRDFEFPIPNLDGPLSSFAFEAAILVYF